MVVFRGVLNFNIGVFGYIDSGKIFFVKVLSFIVFMVFFDKNF